jgi:hypothetical protein
MTDTQVQGADAPSIADVAETTVENAAPEGTQEQPKTDEWKPPTKEEYERLQKKAEKRERIIGKTQAQLKAERQSYQKQQAELIARLEKIENAGKDVKPSVDDPKWKSYQEYEDARDAWLKQELAKDNKGQQPKQEAPEVSERDQQWAQERAQRQHAESAKLAKDIPDFQETFTENADLFEDMPEHLAKAFLAVDQGGLAAYALLKEGKLEGLFNAPEQFAALEVYHAQARGAAMAQKLKKPTNAPAPISAASGASPGGKTPDNMSGKEILKWLGN